ncbi:uncharacterized protein LOC123658684 [Melitaea cinxia]|uniref:uncharacterized protein LOC123658684 n=1 Tax=Melitaea cinxia TaxID=113334 RepID=UPI001E26ED19|nr:uncharacterized protein LOC123658684 [Melitaea cinxia]
MEPVFCRAWPLPYALRPQVDAELDGMLRANVIEPVDTSDWATPLVIVHNPDASYITPCRAEDEACMTSSAQAVLPHIVAGIPEWGMPQADPFVIKDIRSEVNNLKLHFTDNNIAGPGKAKILKVTHDTSKQTIKVVIETPIFITGHYDLQGQLLFFNAVGNGTYTLKTDNIVFKVDLIYKVIEKDGHKYLKITGFEYSYDLVKKVHMKLDNLFGGNEEAAKPILQLLDENWKDVIFELGGPIIKQLLTEYVNIVKKYMLFIPADKLVVY